MQWPEAWCSQSEPGKTWGRMWTIMVLPEALCHVSTSANAPRGGNVGGHLQHSGGNANFPKMELLVLPNIPFISLYEKICLIYIEKHAPKFKRMTDWEVPAALVLSVTRCWRTAHHLIDRSFLGLFLLYIPENWLSGHTGTFEMQ